MGHTGLLTQAGTRTSIDQQLPIHSYTIDVDGGFANRIDNVIALRSEWRELERQVALLNTLYAGARANLAPYYASENNTYEFSDTELDVFFVNADEQGVQTAIQMLFESSSTYQNAAGSISVASSPLAQLRVAIRSNYNEAIGAVTLLKDAAITSAVDLQTLLTNARNKINSLTTALDNAPAGLDRNGKLAQLTGQHQSSRLVFVEQLRDFTEIESLISTLPVETEFANVRTFSEISTPTWEQTKTLYSSSDYQDVSDSYKAAYELAAEFTNYASLNYSEFRNTIRNIRYFDTAYEFLADTFEFEAFKSSYLATQDMVRSTPEVNALLHDQSSLQAKLTSLRADLETVNSIVTKNAAVVSFLDALKAEETDALADLMVELSVSYTKTVSYWFGFSYTVALDYTSDARYVNAVRNKSKATSDYNEAAELSLQAQANQTKLLQEISAVETDLNSVNTQLNAHADITAARRLLDAQYKFLKEMSSSTIKVLSETRGDQAAEEFGTAQSLLSNVEIYENTFTLQTVPGQSAVDGKTSHTIFEPTGRSNSVYVVDTEWDSFSVLSLVGLSSAGIHVSHDSVEQLNVLLGGGSNEISIHDTLESAISEIVVAAGAGDDSFLLASPAGVRDGLTTHSNSVDDFLGAVYVDGQSGSNRFTIRDIGDPTGDVIIQSFHTDGYIALAGMAAGNVYYKADGGNFANGIEITTSAGNDSFDAYALFGSDLTTLNTGTGDDDIQIHNFAIAEDTSLTVNSELDDDVIRLGDATIPATVYAGSDNDTIFGSQFADDLYGETGADLVIGGLGNDVINAGAGNDIVIGDDGYFRNAVNAVDITMRDWPTAAIAISVDVVGDSDDTIDTGHGIDTVMGGSGVDSISTATNTIKSYIASDHAAASFNQQGNLVSLVSTHSGLGGNDQINIGTGTHVLIGGSRCGSFCNHCWNGSCRWRRR